LAGATSRRFSRNRTRECAPFLLFREGLSSEPETSIHAVVQSLLTLCADVKNFLGIRILITMATTFVLISIIPILLIDLLPSPEVALPLSITSSDSGIVHRSFPLDSRSGNSTWNYAKLCEPRQGQCQFGTYSTKNYPSNRTLLWLDEGCEEMQFKAYCPLCPEETTWALDTALLPGSVSSPDPPFFPFQLLVKFPHPDNFADIPSIIYYDGESSRHGTMVGSWYSPDSDLEFFSLLWFDCFAGLDVK
jgi:hypothetical protein